MGIVTSEPYLVHVALSTKYIVHRVLLDLLM